MSEVVIMGLIDPKSIEGVYIKGGLPEDQRRKDLVMGRSFDAKDVFVQVAWASDLIKEVMEERAFQRIGLRASLIRWPRNMVGDTTGVNEIQSMLDECRRFERLGFRPERRYILDVPVFSLSGIHPDMLRIYEPNGEDFGIWEEVKCGQYELYRMKDDARII